MRRFSFARPEPDDEEFPTEEEMLEAQVMDIRANPELQMPTGLFYLQKAQWIQTQIPDENELDNPPPQVMYDVLRMVRTLAEAIECLYALDFDPRQPLSAWVEREARNARR